MLKYKTCSVVIAVYKNDKPKWFEQAINSILAQTVKSDDIVIVRDGAVSGKIEKYLEDCEKRHKEIRVVRLRNNMGAGIARDNGIRVSRNKLVAIMDADDISAENRLELQIAAFNKNPEIAALGGQLAEFERLPSNIVAHRKVPTIATEIRKFARRRSPINNPTSMFAKDIYIKLGGYGPHNRGEDYVLWAKMLQGGYKIANLPDTLLYYRIDRNNYMRRKNWNHLTQTTSTRWAIYKMGVSRLSDFVITTAAHFIIFIMPVSFVKVFYNSVVRQRARRNAGYTAKFRLCLQFSKNDI
jgi:glycosyltransferase involved in cell wall biosynthesis